MKHNRLYILTRAIRLIGMSNAITALSQKSQAYKFKTQILLMWIHKNLNKGHATGNPGSGLTKRICHAHYLFIGIMCSKFHIDDLYTVKGVWEANFFQQTDWWLLYTYTYICWDLIKRFCHFCFVCSALGWKSLRKVHQSIWQVMTEA